MSARPVTVISGAKRPRTGKGFSFKELAEAGVSRTDARRLSLPVDDRRRTSHADNVATIKRLAGAA